MCVCVLLICVLMCVCFRVRRDRSGGDVCVLLICVLMCVFQGMT